MTSQGGKNNCSLNSPLMLASKKYIYNFLLKPFVKSFKPNDAGGFTHYLQRCTDCSTTQFAKSKVALTLPRRGYRKFWTPISKLEQDFEILKFDEIEISRHLGVYKLP